MADNETTEKYVADPCRKVIRRDHYECGFKFLQLENFGEEKPFGNADESIPDHQVKDARPHQWRACIGERLLRQTNNDKDCSEKPPVLAANVCRFGPVDFRFDRHK